MLKKLKFDLQNSSIKISVIIPTLNEERCIGALIDFFLLHQTNELIEIIVVDGFSTDNTISIAKSKNVKVLKSDIKSRAVQLNLGAMNALGNVLYFVHADTQPPKTFTQDIKNALKEGYTHACYRSKFDTESNGMKLNAFFTRFPILISRGGDQTLAIDNRTFKDLNGFDEKFIIMEEYDLIRRAKKIGKLKIFSKACLISCRKYDKNSYFRVNFSNFLVFSMFSLGFSPQTLKATYKKLLH